MEEHNQIAKEAILEVVDNQLSANDPPETKQTLERLISEGYSENEAKEFIGTVVVSEAFEVLQAQETFDKKRFVAALNKLPEIPE
jgi:hypothetical protein